MRIKSFDGANSIVAVRVGSRNGARGLTARFRVVVGINFIWKTAQVALREHMPFDALSRWWLCIRSRIGDGVIVPTLRLVRLLLLPFISMKLALK